MPSGQDIAVTAHQGMRSPIVPDLLDSCSWYVRWILQKYRRNLLTEYQSVTIKVA